MRSRAISTTAPVMLLCHSEPFGFALRAGFLVEDLWNPLLHRSLRDNASARSLRLPAAPTSAQPMESNQNNSPLNRFGRKMLVFQRAMPIPR